MQVSEHVQAIKIPFSLEIGPGKRLERFVYAYLISGNTIWLIDSGVASSSDMILGAVRSIGREPREISRLVLTHAHPDHIGGVLGLLKGLQFEVAAHADDVSWIEDVELQFRERPVPSFKTLVDGPVKVGRVLGDGERLRLDGNTTLTVIHTPGHCPGHIALFFEEEGVLFAGDAIPLPGTMPIYEDVPALVESIRRLKEVKGVKILLSSWDEPRRGNEVDEVLDQGLDYIQKVHDLVLEARAARPSSDSTAVARQVVKKLGLPGFALNPIVLRSVKGHLQAIEESSLFAL